MNVTFDTYKSIKDPWGVARKRGIFGFLSWARVSTRAEMASSTSIRVSAVSMWAKEGLDLVKFLSSYAPPSPSRDSFFAISDISGLALFRYLSSLPPLWFLNLSLNLRRLKSWEFIVWHPESVPYPTKKFQMQARDLILIPNSHFSTPLPSCWLRFYLVAQAYF